MIMYSYSMVIHLYSTQTTYFFVDAVGNASCSAIETCLLQGENLAGDLGLINLPRKDKREKRKQYEMNTKKALAWASVNRTITNAKQPNYAKAQSSLVHCPTRHLETTSLLSSQIEFLPSSLCGAWAVRFHKPHNSLQGTILHKRKYTTNHNKQKMPSFNAPSRVRI